MKHLQKKILYYTIIFLLALFSLAFSLLSLGNVTGLIISESMPLSRTLFVAAIFIILAVLGSIAVRQTKPSRLENNLEKVNIKSSVKEDTYLLRFAKQLEGKERIQKEINHIIGELAKGNTNPGLGVEHLNDAHGISYARGRNGARVFYLMHGKNNYEIIGYSDKGNEERVIRYLREKYPS